jgi:membrane protease subunit HflC
MSILHDHHHHHGNDVHRHDHESDPGQARPAGAASGRRRWRLTLRIGIATVVVLSALMAACFVLVEPGEAVMVLRFGNPVRVVTAPGLAWRLPAPIESVVPVDLRLRSTSSGLQDVGTRDGLRVLVQAFVIWQVEDSPEPIRQFLRAARNRPDAAAEQLRSFIVSSLETVASRFDLASLVNTNPDKVEIGRLELTLRERVDAQLLKVYGISVRQVGIERLTLPNETLAATVTRMKAERQTVAAQRMAEGQRAAAEIRSNADRDARIVVADSRAEAAAIEAKARVEAAAIYGSAYAADPSLYSLLRSIDTLDTVVNDNTRLMLRTDAAPFRVLVDGPPSSGHAPEGSPEIEPPK